MDLFLSFRFYALTEYILFEYFVHLGVFQPTSLDGELGIFLMKSLMLNFA